MGSGLERHEELMARLYVREVMDAVVILHDTSALIGVHDYEISQQGRMEALEVSIWADQDQMEAEVVQRELQQRDVKFPNLRKHWMVQVTPRARLKQLRGRLVPHLQRLENEGVNVLNIADSSLSTDSSASAVAVSLRRLGVMQVRSGGRREEHGTVDIVPSTNRDVSFLADDALPLIEEHLNGDTTSDIMAKLCLSGHERRHVFLWADRPGCPTPYWNIGNLFQRLPNREPDFPKAITDLWCVGSSGGWLWGKGIGWQTVPAPYEALRAISEGESSLLRDLHARKH